MEIINYFFSRSWTPETMASELWESPETGISTDTQARVQSAEQYLSRLGYELKGVKADGNCFFYAYHESYKTIQSIRNIPLLDMQQDPPKFLRESLASLFTNVSGKQGLKEEIEQDNHFVKATDGAHLAHHFEIPLRILTPNETGTVMDLLQYPNAKRDAEVWSTIPQDIRPKTFIFIVDLGGHFVYAAPKPYPLQGRTFQLLFLLGACFVIYQIGKRIFQKNT
jgi:hypothetical protein